MMACGANSSAISTRVHDRVIAEHNYCMSDTHTDSSCYSECRINIQHKVDCYGTIGIRTLIGPSYIYTPSSSMGFHITQILQIIWHELQN